MRCLLKISIPVEVGNARIKDGTLPKIIQSILQDQKPEAAYFAEDNGKRTGFVFINVPEPSDIPRLAEPWFLAFDASVEVHPAMIVDDLVKAGPAIEAAARKYGAVVF